MNNRREISKIKHGAIVRREDNDADRETSETWESISYSTQQILNKNKDTFDWVIAAEAWPPNMFKGFPIPYPKRNLDWNKQLSK